VALHAGHLISFGIAAASANCLVFVPGVSN
jgi:hypothetical protein